MYFVFKNLLLKYFVFQILFSQNTFSQDTITINNKKKLSHTFSPLASMDMNNFIKKETIIC